jgi:putative membrane protein
MSNTDLFPEHTSSDTHSFADIIIQSNIHPPAIQDDDETSQPEFIQEKTPLDNRWRVIHLRRISSLTKSVKNTLSARYHLSVMTMMSKMRVFGNAMKPFPVRLLTMSFLFIAFLYPHNSLVSAFSIPTVGRYFVQSFSSTTTRSRTISARIEYRNVSVEEASKQRQIALFAASLFNTDGRVVSSHSSPAPAFATKSSSLDQYAADIAVVLNELRSDVLDPTLPEIFRRGREPSFTSPWSMEDWDRHSSRWRYWNYLRSFPRDRLLTRCFPQMSVLVAWSALVSWMYVKKVPIISKLSLPLLPLSLLSSFVAALISLRSNQGLDRLNQGRLAFGKVILYTRDMAQLIAVYIYPKDPVLGVKLARHVALFGWLLKNFLRGEAVNGTDLDIVTAMLGPADAAYVMSQRKKPVAVVTRLRQVFVHMAETGQLNSAAEKVLDHTTQELNHCIMTCERIRASPIPPLYTAHTGRLLMFYLFFLPLALTDVLNAWGTVVTTAAVGYTMLGLDEISHLLEQPFKLMPLYQLSKNSMKDVGDALVCQPPALMGADEVDAAAASFVAPPYWDKIDRNIA